MLAPDLDQLRGFVLALERTGLIDRDRLAAAVGLQAWQLDAMLDGEEPSATEAAERLHMRLYAVAATLEATRP